MPSKRLLVVLLGMLLCVFVYADVSESKQWLLKENLAATYKRFVETYGYPELGSQQGFCILGRQFAGSAQVYVLGPDVIPARELARMVADWTGDSNIKGDIQYSLEKATSVALLEFKTSQFLARSGETRINVGSLAAKLRKVDSVQIGWMTPNYAQVSGLPIGKRGERTTIYELSSSSTGDVIVSTRVPPAAPWIMGVAVFYLPVGLALSSILAFHYGRRKDIPIETRRHTLFKRMFVPMIALLASHFALGLSGLVFDYGSEVADVWFGTPPSILMLASAFLVPLLFLIGLSQYARFETWVLGPDPDMMTFRFQKRTVNEFLADNWIRGVGAAIWIGTMFMPQKNHWSDGLRFAGMTLLFLGFGTASRVKRVLVSMAAPDESISKISDELARSLGVPSCPLRIQSGDGDGVVWLGFIEGTLVLSPSFGQRLSEDEQSFLVAHSYAAKKEEEQLLGKMLRDVLPAFVPFAGIAAYLAIAHPGKWSAGFILLGLLGLAAWTFPRAKRRRDIIESEADQMALELIQNPESAASAIKKTVFDTRCENDDPRQSHPATWARIQKLLAHQKAHPGVTGLIGTARALGTTLPLDTGSPGSGPDRDDPSAAG